MTVGSLTPGTIYFLQLEPVGEIGPFPFYKLGFTDKPIDKRLDSLKTGNPFKIVARDSFASEAAGHIELKLHRKYRANLQYLEWYRFDTDAEIDEVIMQARQWHEELKDTVARVAELDETVSNGKTIEATDEVLELARQYQQKELQKQTALREQDKQRGIIIAEALNQGAIFSDVLGAYVSKTNPRYDYKATAKEYPDEWEQCKQPSKIKNTASVHPDYNVKKNLIPESAEAKERRDKNDAELEAMQDVFKSEDVKVLKPNATVVEAQNELNKKIRQMGYLEFEKTELIFRIGLACGENDKIDGVFNWVRTEIEDTKKQQETFKKNFKELLIQKPVAETTKAGKVNWKWLITKAKTSPVDLILVSAESALEDQPSA